MRKRTRIAVIALVVALGFGASGLAWAYFSETTNAQAAGGGTATMAALVVETPTYVYDSGDNKLWPGHAADVKIPLKNTNAVPVQIMSVTAAGVVSSCAGITQDATSLSLWNGATQISDGIIPSNATYTLVITDGVKLDASATAACETQGFSTEWNVVAENR
jgi:hypothetical protein